MTMEQKPSTPFDIETDDISMDDVMENFSDEMFNGQGDFSRGDLVEATVIHHDEKEVYLDLGSKQEGRCSMSEFPEPPDEGSVVPVLVLREGEDGLIRLSRLEAERTIAWAEISEAFNEKTQLSGEVVKQLPQGQGYIVNYGGINLFLPMSQSGPRGRSGRPNLPLNKIIDFKILELKEKNRTAVISHRQVAEEVNEARWNELTTTFSEGDVAEGVVTKKVSFGVFVEICGIEGLLHQSDISWKKYAPFKDRFKVGDSIHVKIVNMDKENNRLSLGLKQLTEDPWEWARRELNVGDVVRGRVTNITDYGAFLELLEGLEGLIHVSELTWSKRVKHPRKYLNMDEEVEAQVLSVDFDNRRIALGIKQLRDDPWDRLSHEVSIGAELEGQVTSVTRFGAFVKVLDDVEGLIHFNDYTWDDRVDRKMLKKGDTVRFKVLEINTDERRISCGIKQLTESPYEALRKKYRKGDALPCKVTGITTFGLFVDIGDGFEGLIHISRIPLGNDEKLEDRFSIGDELTAVLLRIDADEKKIALSIKDYEKKKEQDVIDQYLKKDDSPSTSSLGAFFKKEEEKSE